MKELTKKEVMSNINVVQDVQAVTVRVLNKKIAEQIPLIYTKMIEKLPGMKILGEWDGCVILQDPETKKLVKMGMSPYVEHVGRYVKGARITTEEFTSLEAIFAETIPQLFIG